MNEPFEVPVAEKSPEHDSDGLLSEMPAEKTESVGRPEIASVAADELQNDNGLSNEVDAIGEEEEIESSQVGLKRSDQIFVGTLIVIALVLMIVQWIRLSNWGSEPIEIDRHDSRWYDYRVDVNNATWVEWVQLEGIGETLSRRIVDDRDENGSFESIDELDRVKGIGPKTIEKLRPWLRVGPPEMNRPVK